MRVCIIVSVEIEFYWSNQFLPLRDGIEKWGSFFDVEREFWLKTRKMEKFVANTKIIANEELYLELESDKKKTIFVEISLELNPLKREIVG